MFIYSEIICLHTLHKCNTSYRKGCRCGLCKTIKTLIDAEYRYKNKKFLQQKHKNYYRKNRIKCINAVQKNYKKQRDKKLEYLKNYQQKNKLKFANQQKQYYLKHKNRIIKNQCVAEKEKRNNNPLFNLQKRLSCRIRAAFKNKGWQKGSSKTLLGTDLKNLKTYFESKFKDGMTWENRQSWHIDHIVPLSSAKTEEQLVKLCHYTNLQPLWALDNIKKSNKLV